MIVKRMFWTGLVLLGVLGALAACSGSGQAPATAAPAPANSAPDATPAAAEPPAGATAMPVGGLTVEPVAGAGTAEAPGAEAQAAPTSSVPLDLPALRAYGLKSYVVNIQMRDEVVTPGAKATLAPPTDMEMRYHGDPAPETYSWTTTGSHDGAASTEDFKMLMVDKQMYMFAPDQGKWVKLADSNPQNLPLKADIVDPTRISQVVPTGLFTKENVISRDEKVDGVSTTHYRANAAEMAELLKDAGDDARKAVSGTADFWVANDLGYLKQYTMIANLEDKDKGQYRQTVKFTISSENKPVEIATPAPGSIMSQDEFDKTLATAGPPPTDATPEAPPPGLPTAAP